MVGQFDRANSLKQLGPAIGIVVGPVLATPLLAWWGIEAVLLVDLATFVIGIAAVTMIRFDDAPAVESVSDDGSWRDMWAWMLRLGRPLLVLMAMAAMLNFTLAFINISVLAAATTLAGTAKAGLVLGVGGVAMVVGSLVSATKEIPDDRVGRIAAGSRPSAWVLSAGVAVALGTVPMVMASMSSIYNERVPPQMQGRVFALRLGLSNVLQPVGSLLAGVTIVHVAGPAVTEGVLAGSVGRITGTGPSSGPAAVLLVGGLAILAVALLMARRRGMLDESAANCVDQAEPAVLESAGASRVPG